MRRGHDPADPPSPAATHSPQPKPASPTWPPEGHSTPEIAQALFVTPKTVETHLAHTYQKLNIHARTELAHALSEKHNTGA